MNIPERILMGPGPTTVPQRVLRAMASPTLGHLDPRFIEIMDDTCAKLREVYQTDNSLTFPISATGVGGMECVVTNLMEPGDEAIVCVNGVFGKRMVEVMKRNGVTVHVLDVEWGKTFTEEQIGEVVQRYPKAKALAIVHGEISTGAHQPLEGIAKLLNEEGMLLIVDATGSLAGHPLKVDEWHIDAVYSATQECLSCPPGLSPISFSEAALEVMERRKTSVRSWYFDVSLLKDYYTGSGGRHHHHTAPVNMVYALNEALALVLEEGLEARFERHEKLHRRLRAGLEELGLSYIPDRSLHSLNCVRIPDGVEDEAVRARMLETYGIEIGGGLGPFQGEAWRIGLMGHSATQANVDLVLAALCDCLE
ncbi:pyridoxal-phosphate-dependent aminotransferase family protein [Haloferula sp.]|uniref:pyridoxal-phosphate-dependent aminotransferase family protein n=1 Tax=Haloferula sp. TaxID=2497595 RepID=UPI003C728B68